MESANGVRTSEEVIATKEKEILAFFNLISSSPGAKVFHEILLENQALREKNARFRTAYDQIFDTVEEEKKACRDAQALSASKDDELVKLAAEKEETAIKLERAQRELEATSEGMTAQQRSLKEREGKLLKVEKDLAQKTRELESAISAQGLAERRQRHQAQAVTQFVLSGRGPGNRGRFRLDRPHVAHRADAHPFRAAAHRDVVLRVVTQVALRHVGG